MTHTLYELRLENSKSQKEISDYLRIKPRTYSNYEGRNYIPRKFLEPLANYYQIDVKDIDLTHTSRFKSYCKERKSLSFNLLRLRTSLRMTKSELSQKIGLSIYTISEIERRGSCRPEHFDIVNNFAKQHHYAPQIHSFEDLAKHVQELEKRVKRLELQLALQS